MYGEGSYFATTAEGALYYSKNRAKLSAVTQIICAEVLTGIPMVGYRKMKTLLPDTHSATDALIDPSMFAVFKDASARPAFLITVKDDVKLKNEDESDDESEPSNDDSVPSDDDSVPSDDDSDPSDVDSDSSDDDDDK